MHPTGHAHAVPQRRLRIGRRRSAPERPAPRAIQIPFVRTPSRAPEGAPQRQRSLLWQSVFVTAIVVIGAVWMVERCSDLSTRSELPAGERTALYERALTDLQRLCKDPAPAAFRHCAHQAELLAAVPECSGECRDVVSRWLPRATR